MDDLSFLKAVEKESGEKVSSCYQCYKCTTGCPVVSDMDIMPHRTIRYVMLGEREKVLRSKTIWTCLQCYTCSVRCPNDIHIGHVFDTLRKIAVREGKAQNKDVWVFDELFLDSVRKHGRLYEIEAMMRYMLSKRDLFSNTRVGMDMMRKGRINILPHNIKDKKGMKEIYERIAADHAEAQKRANS
jgi:heterodisulfide reductase subunit C